MSEEIKIPGLEDLLSCLNPGEVIYIGRDDHRLRYWIRKEQNTCNLTVQDISEFGQVGGIIRKDTEK